MEIENEAIQRLGITPVDRKSPLPRYHQVYLDLSNIIRSEKLNPGDMLPPEVDLARAYRVGRQTIRAAIARLVNENLLERYAGIGTFLRAQSDRTKFYLDRSFTQQMAEMGLKAHSKVVKLSTGVIDGSSPAELQKKMGMPCLNLVRLRFGDANPIGLQASTIVTERAPDLEKFNFNLRSLYDVLSKEYRLPIVEISHVVSAVSASEVQSELLQTAPGAPLLMVRTTATLENHEPIESTISYYRADRYEFSTTHSFQECD